MNAILHKDKKLTKDMLYYTHETWDQYLRKMNQYFTLAAEKSKKEGKSCNFIFDILIRPAFAFFKMYILKLGILDGQIGFALCANYANYMLNKYLKLDYLNKK